MKLTVTIDGCVALPYADDTTHREELNMFVTMSRDEDGVWIVECPAIPGCVSQGDTKEEALANIREAIELCMEVRAEQGLPTTYEIHQVETRPLEVVA